MDVINNVKNITTVENLEFDKFYIYANDDRLILTPKNGDVYYSFNKESLTIKDSEGELALSPSHLNINNKDVYIGLSGKILDYISWDKSTNEFKIGEDFIEFDSLKEQFVFKGIIDECNLSQQLKDKLEFNKGDVGPQGPQGPQGEPGKDGSDTSRYTWILYAEHNIDLNPNMSIYELGLSKTPTIKSKYMGCLYNQIDEQPDFNIDNITNIEKYTWIRYGNQIYSVKVLGNNIFKIPKNSFGESSVPNYLDLEGVVAFPNVRNCYWEEYDFDISEYVKIKGTDDVKNLRINFSDYKDFFKNGNSILNIRFVVIPDDDLHNKIVDDIVSIYALKEGDDTNTISLSNNMHTLIADENGNISDTEYANAYTIIKHHLGAEQISLRLEDFSFKSRTARTEYVCLLQRDVNYADKTNIKLSIISLSDYADVIEITHLPTNITSNFSIFKSGDGTVRVVKINGTSTVWKEGDVFVPNELVLNSYGTGGVVVKHWEYNNIKTNGYQIISNSESSNLILNTHQFFTNGVSKCLFKVVYENTVSKIETHDIHEVILLDSQYNLHISNTQDKVSKDEFNEYDFISVYTDVTLYQGNSIVPINVIDNHDKLNGGVSYDLGDIIVQSNNNSTIYDYVRLGEDDNGKIRIILYYCDGPDFITITHKLTRQKKIFSILIDEMYNTSVDIIGENIFYYDKDNNCKPDFITLNTSSVHISPDEIIKWFYSDGTENGWIELEDCRNSKELIVYPDDKQWLGYTPDIAKFKVSFGDDSANVDVVSVYKIRHGVDSKHLILSNETQNVYVDEDGIIPRDENGNIKQSVITDVNFVVGDELLESNIQDYTLEFTNCSGELGQYIDDKYTLKLKITDLTEDYGTVKVIRIVKGLSYYKIMHVYKRADGKVRIVKINGTQTVWREGDVFKPATISLNSYGTNGLVVKEWMYKTSNTNDYIPIPNSQNNELNLKSGDYFNNNTSLIQFKAVYTNEKTSIDVCDIHDVILLDNGFNLALSNYQDKVPVDTYNNYIYQSVHTEVSLYQGNELIPINVLSNALLRGGVKNSVGDLNIQASNIGTSFRVDALDGENKGKVKITLLECSEPDFITITHTLTGQKKVFSILMDGKYNTSVDIIAENIFRYDKFGVCKPDSITLQTSSFHIQDNEHIKWFYYNKSNNWVEIEDARDSKEYTVYHDERWKGFNENTAKFKVAFGEDVSNVDVISIYKIRDGYDGVSFTLSNETQSVTTDENGVYETTSDGNMLQSVSTDINLYKGSMRIESSIDNYTVEFDNCSGTLLQSSDDKYTVKLKISNLTNDYGTAVISRSYENTVYTKTMHIYKSKQGIHGNAGDWMTFVFKESANKPNAIEGIGLSPIPNGWVNSPTNNGVWWSSNAMVDGVTNKTKNTFSEPQRITAQETYVLDLSNENASVACDDKGIIIGALPKCKATLYISGKNVDGVTYSIVDNIEAVSSINAISGEITIKNLISDTTELKVRAVYGAFFYEKIMTITKIKDGKDSVIYDLKPECNSILLNESEGVITPSSILSDYLIQKGTDTYIIDSPDTVINGLTDNITMKVWSTSTNKETEILVHAPYIISVNDKQIIFKLYKNGVLVDTESVPVLSDGPKYINEFAVGGKDTAPLESANWTTDVPKFSSSKGEYLWQRSVQVINGEKFIKGVWRVSGESGSNSYVHIRYAINLNEMLDIKPSDEDMAKAVYMGTMTSTTNEYSSVWGDYVWTKIKGERGEAGSIGLTGPQGERGPQGAVGPIGPDGKPTYTWIKYSPYANGDNMTDDPNEETRYLGLSYNNAESQNQSQVSGDPTYYHWSKIKGEQGDTGEQGPIGPDGKPRYTWIKYSPNSDGGSMTDVPDVNTNYIGLAYNKETPNESNDPKVYTWSKFKGESGVSSYMHVRYSMYSNGASMSESPSGMVYMGLCVSALNTPPNDPSLYKWSKIKGEQGDTGPQGATGPDGKTYYLYIKYANDDNVMTDEAVIGTTKMGTCVTTDTTKPNEYGRYTWVRIKGEPGDKGLIPLLKIWDAHTVYTRTSTHQDHVAYRYKENGVDKTKYYTLKPNVPSSQGNNPMTSTTIWEEIQSFDLVATNTLLAENANLGGFIFKNNQLVSQKTHVENGTQVPNIVLDGYGGSITASMGTFKGCVEADSGSLKDLTLTGELTAYDTRSNRNLTITNNIDSNVLKSKAFYKTNEDSFIQPMISDIRNTIIFSGLFIGLKGRAEVKTSDLRLDKSMYIISFSLSGTVVNEVGFDNIEEFITVDICGYRRNGTYKNYPLMRGFEHYPNKLSTSVIKNYVNSGQKCIMVFDLLNIDDDIIGNQIKITCGTNGAHVGVDTKRTIVLSDIMLTPTKTNTIPPSLTYTDKNGDYSGNVMVHTNNLSTNSSNGIHNFQLMSTGDVICKSVVSNNYLSEYMVIDKTMLVNGGYVYINTEYCNVFHIDTSNCNPSDKYNICFYTDNFEKASSNTVYRYSTSTDTPSVKIGFSSSVLSAAFVSYSEGLSKGVLDLQKNACFIKFDTIPLKTKYGVLVTSKCNL